MKKRKKWTALLLVLSLLLSCFACSNADQEAIYSSALAGAQGESSAEVEASSQPREEGAEESGLSGTLVISIPLPSLPLEQWADRFMEAHPGVKITIDCLESDTATASPDWSQKYVEKTVVALTSGDAPDIIDMDLLPIYRYANSGYFEDFYAYMEKDPNVQIENYYTNILEAFETPGGQLPILPMGIAFTPLVFNTYMMDAMGVDVEEAYPDGVGWRDLVDLFQRALEEGMADEDTYFAKDQSPALLDIYELSAFVDLRNEQAYFESQDFLEYLQAMDSLPFERSFSEGGLFGSSSATFSPSNYFVQTSDVTLYGLGYWEPTMTFAGNTTPVLYQANEGEYVFTTAGTYGIPSSGENKELAWEFLKFMADEQDYDTFEVEPALKEVQYSALHFHGIPINRVNFKNVCGKIYNEMFRERLFEKFDGFVKKMNMFHFSDDNLCVALGEIQSEFYDSHLITAEECAQQMQERAEIYLRE